MKMTLVRGPMFAERLWSDPPTHGSGSGVTQYGQTNLNSSQVIPFLNLHVHMSET